MKYGLVLSTLLLSSCSYLGIDSWFESSDQGEPVAERRVTVDKPKRAQYQLGKNKNGINIYDQHHRYTFFMKINRTVTFENAHREKNQIAGSKEEQKLGDICHMKRVVGSYTRDILLVDKDPRLFRLMRSVSTSEDKASPILIAVDVKSGDTTFEIHCPNVNQYDTAILEENFGFEVIPEKNKLKENFI